jgi:glutathione S-transferase
MLRLHGFSASNYYNIPKLALLEKGVSFEEVTVYTGAGERYRPDYLEMSPIGKVPCLETEEGFLTESRCIVDYIERIAPEPPLYPPTAFGKAKMLELSQVIDLYLELPARRLIPNLFAGKPPPERVAGEVLEALAKGAHALAKLAKFDAYLLGDQFTAADIAAVVHVPVVRRIIKNVLARDPLAEVPGLLEYIARIEKRPTVQRVRADYKANYPEFDRHIRSLYDVARA